MKGSTRPWQSSVDCNSPPLLTSTRSVLHARKLRSLPRYLMMKKFARSPKYGARILQVDVASRQQNRVAERGARSTVLLGSKCVSYLVTSTHRIYWRQRTVTEHHIGVIISVGLGHLAWCIASSTYLIKARTFASISQTKKRMALNGTETNQRRISPPVGPGRAAAFNELLYDKINKTKSNTAPSWCVNFANLRNKPNCRWSGKCLFTGSRGINSNIPVPYPAKAFYRVSRHINRSSPHDHLRNCV